ncbi:MAG: PEP-CTERM sorting domain-containing protein [Snowella sp.]|nr:PEP-CTERM sorting domain-containing protein [Snowella sp.]
MQISKIPFNLPGLALGTVTALWGLSNPSSVQAFSIGIDTVIFNGSTAFLPAKADPTRPYVTLDFDDLAPDQVALKITANFANSGTYGGGYVDHLTFNIAQDLRANPVRLAYSSGISPSGSSSWLVNRNDSYDNVSGYGGTYKNNWDFLINFPNGNAQRLKANLISNFVLTGTGLNVSQFNVPYPNGDNPLAAAHIGGYGRSAAFGGYGTTPVPEPITLIGSGIALGFGAFLKRKAKQKK